MRATVNSTKPQTTSFVEQDTALCLFRFVIVNYDASSLMCVDCIVYYYHVAKWKESPAIPGLYLYASHRWIINELTDGHHCFFIQQ